MTEINSKKPLQSKTIVTSVVQLITAAIVALLGFMQGEATGELLADVLGPEGLALALAALMAVKSFWDIWVRFNTDKPIG